MFSVLQFWLVFWIGFGVGLALARATVVERNLVPKIETYQSTDYFSVFIVIYTQILLYLVIGSRMEIECWWPPIYSVLCSAIKSQFLNRYLNQYLYSFTNPLAFKKLIYFFEPKSLPKCISKLKILSSNNPSLTLIHRLQWWLLDYRDFLSGKALEQK